MSSSPCVGERKTLIGLWTHWSRAFKMPLSRGKERLLKEAIRRTELMAKFERVGLLGFGVHENERDSIVQADG